MPVTLSWAVLWFHRRIPDELESFRFHSDPLRSYPILPTELPVSLSRLMNSGLIDILGSAHAPTKVRSRIEVAHVQVLADRTV